jgi:prepilin-type N-terminal cleavage/methylation domain-containing protein
MSSIIQRKSRKGEKEMRKQKGFSLIELLIVVAIILIIAAIAIPNLLRARIAANESSAAASLRTIGTAEVSYATSFPATGFAVALTNLGGASPCVPAVATGCLIDTSLAGGTKSGYLFVAVGGAADLNGSFTQFTSNGNPNTLHTTGNKGFCGTEDNVIHFTSTSGGALTHDPCQATTPIGN